MPLRDHFHSPMLEQAQWNEIHGSWPTRIMDAVEDVLPPGYAVSSNVKMGRKHEIDIAAYSRDRLRYSNDAGNNGGGGTATWAPPRPSVETSADWIDYDSFEVNVYDQVRSRRLVASIELVSPANKDRPESRLDFLKKCADLLRVGVCVTIIDVVTVPRFDLFTELLLMLREQPPAPPDSECYTTTSRLRTDGESERLEHWHQKLEIGRTLPTIPIWLSETLAVPLDLEATYEYTLRKLRIE